MTTGPDVPFAELLPALTEELASSLRAKDREDLARQIPQLRIVGRCGCGDDFCSTVHTKPSAGVERTPGLDDSVCAGLERGIVVLDLNDGIVRSVEILYRPDVEARLATVLERRVRKPLP